MSFPNFVLLNVGLQPDRVLQALKRYMAAEQKDRRHTLRHYQHIVAVDPQKAEQMKFQVRVYLLRISFCSQTPVLLWRSIFFADHIIVRTLCAE